MFKVFGKPRAVRRRLAMLLVGCVWSAGFQRAEAADTISGNITVIQADPVILQPGELFDLNGRTLTFTPRAGGGYTTSVGGLSFDSRLGTNLQEGDDDSVLVTLPFRFPFFGSIQTAVYVNSNGHLTFNNYSFAYHFNGGNSGSLGLDLSAVFDNFVEFLPRIAALWEDWDPRTVGGVFVNSLPDRLIVTWNGLPLYNTTSPTATFQAILFSSGVVQIHYQNVTTTPGGGYLVGISPGSVSSFSRAFNAAGDSPYSNEAASSPAAFADEPLTAGTTPVRAVHIGELRQTVDASRACAGLGTAAWTDSIAADVAIKAVHVQELRDNLRPARDRFGMPAVSYTDDPLTPGVLIKKVHVDELRQAVR